MGLSESTSSSVPWCSVFPSSSTSRVPIESLSLRHEFASLISFFLLVTIDTTSDAVDMDQYHINSWEDIGKIDFSGLSIQNIYEFYFADLGLAFDFYNSYAKTRGFNVRKSRSRKVDGKVIEKHIFVLVKAID
ncbi:hypothetical protein Ahy_B08g091152 [Arachis hypogaea]|uniref:FAR1 domain-containing protein n=1 Tax=Arachis hypogaea TaxID=3818 RepID=A0A444Y1J5_ARAHY|nr:hypothetical protein Ahy_B08g091152 [Arachis hypogaea]